MTDQVWTSYATLGHIRRIKLCQFKPYYVSVSLVSCD